MASRNLTSKDLSKLIVKLRENKIYHLETIKDNIFRVATFSNGERIEKYLKISKASIDCESDYGHWLFSSTISDRLSETEHYVYVLIDLMDNLHIVPTKVVKEVVDNYHYNWMANPGKRVKKHKDSNIRIFTDPDGRYIDNYGEIKR